MVGRDSINWSLYKIVFGFQSIYLFFGEFYSYTPTPEYCFMISKIKIDIVYLYI